MVVGEPRAGQHDAGDERAQHRLDVQPLGDEAEAERGREDDGEPGERIVALRSDPTQRRIDEALAERERQEEEHEQTHDGECQLVELHTAGLGEAGDEPEGHPPDHVVHHAGRQRQLTEVAPHEAHLRQDLGDHGQ